MKLTFLATCLLASTGTAGCSLVVGNSIDPYGGEGEGEGEGEQVDFRGEYRLQVTNGQNGCGTDAWREGETTSDVPFTITQDGAALTGQLGGWWSTLANLYVGNDRATGTATGNHMALRLVGTRNLTRDACQYQVDALIEGDLTGDALAGGVRYLAVTRGAPECAMLEGCETVQAFNGTRPPR